MMKFTAVYAYMAGLVLFQDVVRPSNAMLDPTLTGAAIVGVITAAVLGALQIIKSRSDAAALRETAAERAKDREEAAAIRAKDREEAAEDRRAMLLKASQAVAVSEANSKKSDEIITGVAKVHELTNSQNSQLQKNIEVLTEKLTGVEKLNAQLLQQIKDTATSQATADLQTAIRTVPQGLTMPTAAAPAGPLASVPVPSSDAATEQLGKIETNTSETAKNTAKTDAAVQELKK